MCRPTDFTDKKMWDARMMIERSIAVKCPTIAVHLAGSKKVQQALAEPEALEYFLGENKDYINRLRSVFAGLYTLDPIDDIKDPKVRELAVLSRQEAIINPHRYVIKPQREGGGNNLYGQDLHAALTTLTPDELSAYILMERILPPAQKASLMRDAKTIVVSLFFLARK